MMRVILIAITCPPPQHWSGPGLVPSGPNAVLEILAGPGPGPDHTGTVPGPDRGPVHFGPVPVWSWSRTGPTGDCDIPIYKESVQWDYGPRWTNSGFALNSSLDPDT